MSPRGGPSSSRIAGLIVRDRPVAVSTNARVLKVAGEHLRRLGPKQVTVVAVAAALGMTHANVYRHFASKDSLLDAVVGEWLREVETRLAAIADSPDPPDDKIERLLTALATAQRELLLRDPHVFAVHRDAAAASRPIARRHRGRLRTLVERVVDEGIGTGTFGAQDRERAVAGIFDASFRFTHPIAIGNEADVPVDLRDARLSAVILMIQRALRTGIP